MKRYLRLGINIDHIATIRNARGGRHPDPVRAARQVARAGADGITAHLREDRRHISDEDIARLSCEVKLPINLEMAATDEMLEIALKSHPHAACIVPESREERTTEGGLDAVAGYNKLAPYVRQLGEADIRVSLFIEPDVRQVEAAVLLGVPVVELHTGKYCDAVGAERDYEFGRIITAAERVIESGLECHAGHGLNYDSVAAIASLPMIEELNIGHFLVGEAIYSGLDSAIKRMRAIMDTARADADGERSA